MKSPFLLKFSIHLLAILLEQHVLSMPIKSFQLRIMKEGKAYCSGHWRSFFAVFVS